MADLLQFGPQEGYLLVVGGARVRHPLVTVGVLPLDVALRGVPLPCHRCELCLRGVALGPDLV